MKNMAVMLYRAFDNLPLMTLVYHSTFHLPISMVEQVPFTMFIAGFVLCGSVGVLLINDNNLTGCRSKIMQNNYDQCFTTNENSPESYLTNSPEPNICLITSVGWHIRNLWKIFVVIPQTLDGL